MAYQVFAGKERIGRVTIERFKEWVRLRWTFNKKTYCLTIGKDGKDAIKAARAKAQTIDADMVFDRFDATLAKYGKQQRASVLRVVAPEERAIALRDLWDRFLVDKLPNLKATSQDEYLNFTHLLDKLEAQGSEALSFKALNTKQALLTITTVDQTRRMLQYLSACCDWGIKHRLIADNPYSGLASEMPKRKSTVNPNPAAFTEEEREAVIETFKSYQKPGMNFSHYAPIVEFWFLTGCRPSEAIGLAWGNILDDCNVIVFNCSIVTVRGVQMRSEGSKNNKSRSIAASNRVRHLLLSVRPEDYKSNSLVFPSPTGQAINYPNFASKLWGKLVDPIKPNTTPYNCRDTFISSQLLKGVPSAVIAKWCDTSTSMIDTNYADKLKLSQLKPVD